MTIDMLMLKRLAVKDNVGVRACAFFNHRHGPALRRRDNPPSSLRAPLMQRKKLAIVVRQQYIDTRYIVDLYKE
jgi:hypothetical protein